MKFEGNKQKHHSYVTKTTALQKHFIKNYESMINYESQQRLVTFRLSNTHCSKTKK